MEFTQKDIEFIRQDQKLEIKYETIKNFESKSLIRITKKLIQETNIKRLKDDGRKSKRTTQTTKPQMLNLRFKTFFLSNNKALIRNIAWSFWKTIPTDQRSKNILEAIYGVNGLPITQNMLAVGFEEE